MGASITTAHADEHSHHDDDHAHDLPFWKKYVFSTDHKIDRYTSMVSPPWCSSSGFYLMMVMRWSIAYPHRGRCLAWLAAFLDDGRRWLQMGR